MKKKSTETKEKIIQAAYELIQEQGYQATTLEGIVKRAGLTRGAFYYYFSDKHEILEELESRYESMYRKPYNDLEKMNTSRASIKRLIMNNILSKREPNPYAVMFRYRVESGIQLKDLQEKQCELDNDFIGIIEGLIEEGIAAGEFPEELDAQKRAQQIYYVLLGYETFLLTHGKVPYDREEAEQWVDDLAESVLKSLQ